MAFGSVMAARGGMAAGFERSAHSLRHFMATYFNDPRRAQKILGHANLKTTEIYLRELGVDMAVAGVFESITNEITNSSEEGKNKRATVVQ